jgi:hypothetical protein
VKGTGFSPYINALKETRALAPEGNFFRICLAACGKSLVLKGHDFSRAVNATKQTRALAPEGNFFRICLAACGKSLGLKGHDFSRAVNATKQKRALAPEGNFFRICLAACGKSLGLKGHDFSRAVNATKQARALAPEGNFFRICLGLLLYFVALASLPCTAQTTPTQPSQQPAPPASQPHQGKILFSRSTDESGQTTTQTVPAVVPPQVAPKAQVPAPQVPEPQVPERQAVSFSSFDLDIHLLPAAQQIAVRALVTIRNDGQTPLTRIPLQISSSLNWEAIRVQDKAVAFQVATINSDADHTGQLHEALIPLAAPLAPGQTLQLDVTYSGPIALSAQRLQSIGAPDALALHSDWDQISLPFTGLRGFGNVVWYPVVSVPVMLGDGARLFDEIGSHKLRLSGARFRLRLTVEFPHGQAPTVALVNGHSVPLAITESAGSLDQSQEVASIATADSGHSTLGFEAPSLFVAIRAPHPGPNLTAWALPEDNVAVEFWTTAATAVTPFLKGWLGLQPRSPLTLLDLPDPEDAPFETGALLAAPLREPGPKANPNALNGVLVHALTHAWIALPNSPTAPATPTSLASSNLSASQNSAASPNSAAPNSPLAPTSPQPPPAWLNEGVANFISTLWEEKQNGRDSALRALEAGRPALALSEPASPGQSPGQPLAAATSPVYYRTKAAYVLWMLRDLAGDPALSATLSAYYQLAGNSVADNPAVQNPAPVKGTGFSPYINSKDSTRALAPEGGSSGKSFEKLLEATEYHPDLAWFFADWVDADKGLPDLTIDGVFPTSASAGNWLVAVNVSNAGYAAADVPVIVRSGMGSDARSVAQRVRVPARGKAIQRVLIQGKPTEVQVNDGTVPETQASIHITKLEEPAQAPPGSSQSNPPKR